MISYKRTNNKKGLETDSKQLTQISNTGKGPLKLGKPATNNYSLLKREFLNRIENLEWEVNDTRFGRACARMNENIQEVEHNCIYCC